MSIKILLADDHVVLRQGLSKSLQSEKDIEIVGHANNGHAAVRLARELSPNVIIMDISMPDLNGIEATRQITKATPESKVIGLSMHSTKKFVMEMFKAGASGYLLKDCEYDELITAIRTVAAGKTYICSSIGDILITTASSTKQNEQTAFSVLTQREREVLQLLSEGKTTKQIANILHISPKTVEVHRLNVMNKLDIDNVAQLTKYAIQEGLTQVEP